MNYNNPDLIERLAAEYVLGTLRGAARRRFAELRNAYIPARRATARWEERLARLALRLPPVTPPAEVWPRIEAQLGVSEHRASAPVTSLWKALAAGMAFLSIGLGTLLVVRQPEVQIETVAPAHVSIIADDQAPLWLINAFPDRSQLQVRALRTIDIPADRSAELWMLPDAGAAPVSLGLLPLTGEVTLPLAAAAADTLARTPTLAVSLEPQGGSPTGAPTGPVLYTAPLVRLPG